jgi:hypothetical protein
MANLLKNWKTYMIIDFQNHIYGFINSASDINEFYSNKNINIATLTKNSHNVLTNAILVKIKTKEEIQIKFSSGNTLCI